MSVKIFSALIQGLEAKLIEVEVDILQGMPAFSIVGLGDTAVQEAKERIHSALKNSGASYPQQKKIINLAPAHLKKNGADFDLPMAIGLLAASKQLEVPNDALFIGELALNGEVRPISGALSIAVFAHDHHWKKLFIPASNVHEASLIKGLQIFPVTTLKQLLDHYQQRALLRPYRPKLSDKKNNSFNSECDFAFIQGQENAKRALEISAASNHHILLYGPPGVGKTLLAKALPSILPPLSSQEFLEVMQIYSCAGLLAQKGNSDYVRPFRQVHHSASRIALTGGGSRIHPGEISLAHHGVLFLDEIAEFPRAHIEVLRQPLEEKQIYLARGSGTIKYPADFTLVAAMNPCPCGYFGDSQQSCHCTATQILHYQKKISGPIRDRLDLSIPVTRQPLQILGKTVPKSSQEIRGKIIKARLLQHQRFQNETIKLNSKMNSSHLKKYCQLLPKLQDFLFEACEKLHLSARSYHQLLKISRTIADLNEHDQIRLEDLSEALQYRHRTQ